MRRLLHRRKGVVIAVLALGLGALFAFPFRNRDDVKCRMHSRQLHHALKPMAECRNIRWNGSAPYSLYTNSLGFRDRSPRKVPVKSPLHRIVFFGDSFTEGVGVDFDESFAGRLGNALAGRGIEVLDAGVASYSPIIYYHQLKALFDAKVLQADEAIVFIDISDMQDEVIYEEDRSGDVVRSARAQRELDLAYKDRPSSFFMRVLRVLRHLDSGSPLLNVLGDVFQWTAARIAPPGIADIMLDQRYRSGWTIDYDKLEKYGKEGQARAARNMESFVALARANGIRKISVVVYPWPLQIYERDLDSVHVRFWRDWCARNGVGFLDLFPKFINGEPAEAVYRKYFSFYDVHWNAEGHRLVAEALLEFLEPEGQSHAASNR